MVKRNIAIALIIIILFVVLILMGVLLWWIKNGFGGRGHVSSTDESTTDDEAV